jgi:cytochrome P450
VIPFAHRDPDDFHDPDSFSPERHLDGASGQLLIWARGPHDAQVDPSDRICPGKGVAIAIGKTVCASLLRCSWRLEEPVEWDSRRFSLNVAAPKGKLPVREFAPIGT